MISPLEPEVFVRDHWDAHRMVHVSGRAGKYDDFYSTADLDALLESLRAANRPVDIIGAIREDQQQSPLDVALGRERTAPILPRPIQIGDLDRWLAAGGTAYLLGLNRVDEKLAALCTRMQQELSYPGEINCDAFVSAPSSGFHLVHFDTPAMFTMQLHGEKIWRVGESAALPWPRENAMVMQDGRPRYHRRGEGEPTYAWEQLGDFDPESLRTVVLKEGDFLFMPAGTWHGVRAHRELGAVSLGFRAEPCAWPAELAGAIPPEAMAEIQAELAWRHPPLTWPPHTGPGLAPKSRQFLAHRTEAVLRWLRSR